MDKLFILNLVKMTQVTRKTFFEKYALIQEIMKANYVCDAFRIYTVCPTKSGVITYQSIDMVYSFEDAMEALNEDIENRCFVKTQLTFNEIPNINTCSKKKLLNRVWICREFHTDSCTYGCNKKYCIDHDYRYFEVLIKPKMYMALVSPIYTNNFTKDIMKKLVDTDNFLCFRN